MDQIRKMSTWYAWIQSMRPKTLILSVVPFALGSLLALPLDNPRLMGYAILSALFIQIGTNFINEGYDVQKGADSETRLGPKRGVQAGVLSVKQVISGGLICFVLAMISGLPLIAFGGWPIFLTLSISVLCGYLYTGGPLPLAYHGLGEAFVLLFFGVVSTAAAHYFQTGELSFKSFLLGVQLGLLATLPIAINNLRDIQDDAAANKRTLAVRFGTLFARIEITVLAFLPFGLNFLWEQQLVMLLPWLSLPLALTVVRGVWTHKPGKIYNNFLGLSIMFYVAFSLLLAVGVIWTGIV